MPPVFAILLGLASSLAILFAVALAFADPEAEAQRGVAAGG